MSWMKYQFDIKVKLRSLKYGENFLLIDLSIDLQGYTSKKVGWLWYLFTGHLWVSEENLYSAHVEYSSKVIMEHRYQFMQQTSLLANPFEKLYTVRGPFTCKKVAIYIKFCLVIILIKIQSRSKISNLMRNPVYDSCCYKGCYLFTE